MSGHGQHDEHANEHVNEHAVHHDDHHDGGTSDDFPADEPRSPGWLPLLGGALLLAGVLGYMAFGSSDKSPELSANGEPAPAAAQSAAVQPGSARRPALARPPGAVMPPNHPRAPSE